MSKRTKTSHGKVSLLSLTEQYPDEESARRWFEEQMWPDGQPVCGHCGSTNTSPVPNEDPMPYWCRDCREYSSVKTNTVMHGSKLPLRKWLFALFLEAMNPKGIASTRLAEAIGISQKSAWFMLHRIREGFAAAVDGEPFDGPVECDETHVGGRRRNLSNKKRRALYRAGIKGAVNQSIVVGMRDRATKHVRAEHFSQVNRGSVHAFVNENASHDATLISDESALYKDLRAQHHTVNHSMCEYARDDVSTNGIESFWSGVKRSRFGVYHKISEKHLNRYVRQLSGKNNLRSKDTMSVMSSAASGFAGKRLPYKKLIEDTGFKSGARPTRQKPS